MAKGRKPLTDEERPEREKRDRERMDEAARELFVGALGQNPRPLPRLLAGLTRSSSLTNAPTPPGWPAFTPGSP
jgi:hypothetical protein